MVALSQSAELAGQLVAQWFELVDLELTCLRRLPRVDVPDDPLREGLVTLLKGNQCRNRGAVAAAGCWALVHLQRVERRDQAGSRAGICSAGHGRTLKPVGVEVGVLAHREEPGLPIHIPGRGGACGPVDLQTHQVAGEDRGRRYPDQQDT